MSDEPLWLHECPSCKHEFYTDAFEIHVRCPKCELELIVDWDYTKENGISHSLIIND